MIRLIPLLGIVLCTVTAPAQRPGAPSLSEARQAEAQSQKDMPPPLYQKATVDPAKLKREATELASLADSVPPAIDAATRGVLPKDLTDKLKRIEKLAKQLRSQLSQ